MTGVQTCALPICFPVTIQKSIELLRDIQKTHPESTHIIGQTLINSAHIYSSQKKFDASERSLKEAISIFKNEKSTPFTSNADTSFALTQLAILYLNTNRHQDAETYITESINIASAAIKDNSNTSKVMIAAPLAIQGKLFAITGRYEAAEAPLQRAINMLESIPDDLS